MDYFRENRRRSQQRKRITGNEVSAIAGLQDAVAQLAQSVRHIADTADSSWQEYEEEHGGLLASVAELTHRVGMIEHEARQFQSELDALRGDD